MLESNSDNLIQQIEPVKEEENYEDIDDFIFSEITGKPVSER